MLLLKRWPVSKLSYYFTKISFKSAALYLFKLIVFHLTNNAIQLFTLPTAEGVNYTRFGNIGRNASNGLNLFGNTKFKKKGSISGNLNVLYTDLEAANASMMYKANLNASYSFPKGISVQVIGKFNSPQVTLQDKSSSRIYYNFIFNIKIKLITNFTAQAKSIYFTLLKQYVYRRSYHLR